MLFLITTSIYKDYKNEQQILAIKMENEDLHQENIQKKDDLLYFRSEQFKDKYAKQNLGKINPGEKVIVFAEEKENIFFQDASNKKFERDPATLPQLEQWYQYFLGDSDFKLKNNY